MGIVINSVDTTFAHLFTSLQLCTSSTPLGHVAQKKLTDHLVNMVVHYRKNPTTRSYARGACRRGACRRGSCRRGSVNKGLIPSMVLLVKYSLIEESTRRPMYEIFIPGAMLVPRYIMPYASHLEPRNFN